MNYIGCFLKNKRNIVVCAITLILSLLTIFAFSFKIKENTNANKTFNNSTCEVIAIENQKRSKNSYAYLGDGLPFTKQKDTYDSLNVILLQNIKNVEYDSASLFNSSNEINGSIKNLKTNEVAICESLCAYNLDIGSEVFINNKPVKVKAIYRDVYQINRANINEKTYTAVLGNNSFDTTRTAKFLNFDPSGIIFGNTNDVTTKKNITKSININTGIFVGLQMIIILVLIISSDLLHFKSEVKFLKRIERLGDSKWFAYAFAFEYIYILPLLLLGLLLILLLKLPVWLLAAFGCLLILYKFLSILILLNNMRKETIYG